MSPIFLFAPGAGAPSTHHWMQHWAKLLRRIGRVRLFDYPYMQSGSRRPDSLKNLIAAHRAAFQETRQAHRGPIFLIGKSMGARISCHLALEEEVVAVICLGYPLLGGGDPMKLRDQVLRESMRPILFVQGTRDPLCPLDLLTGVRREMSAPSELEIVEGGDHSLLVGKRQLAAKGETQEDVDARILGRIGRFVHKQLTPDDPAAIVGR